MASIGNIEAEVNQIVNNFCNNNEKMQDLNDNELKKRKHSMAKAFSEIFDENKGYEKEISDYLDKESFSTKSAVITQNGIVDVDIIRQNVTSIVQQAKVKNENYTNNIADIATNKINENSINSIIDFYRELSKEPLENIIQHYKNKYKDLPFSDAQKNEVAENMGEAIKSGLAEKVAEILNIKDPVERQKRIFEIPQEYETCLLVIDQVTEGIEGDITGDKACDEDAMRKTFSYIYEKVGGNDKTIAFFMQNKKNIGKIQKELITLHTKSDIEKAEYLEELRESGVFGDIEKEEFEILYAEAQIQIDYIKERELELEIEEALAKEEIEKAEELDAKRQKLENRRKNGRKQLVKRIERLRNDDRTNNVQENGESSIPLEEKQSGPKQDFPTVKLIEGVSKALSGKHARETIDILMEITQGIEGEGISVDDIKKYLEDYLQGDKKKEYGNEETIQILSTDSLLQRLSSILNDNERRQAFIGNLQEVSQSLDKMEIPLSEQEVNRLLSIFERGEHSQEEVRQDGAVETTILEDKLALDETHLDTNIRKETDTIRREEPDDLDNSDATIEVEESALRKFARGVLKNVARIPIVGNLVQRTKLIEEQKAIGDGSDHQKVVGPVASDATFYPLWKRVQMKAIDIVENLTKRVTPQKEDEQVNFPDTSWKRPTDNDKTQSNSEDREQADSSKPNMEQGKTSFDDWVQVKEQPIVPVGVGNKTPDSKVKDATRSEDKPVPEDDHDEISS